MKRPVFNSSRLAQSLGTAALGATLLLPCAAHAFFEDSDARRAILELRTRVDQIQTVDQNTAKEIQQVRSSLLDLQGQISSLNNEVSSLRGQNEELAESLKQMQERMKQVEPQQVNLDGTQFTAPPAEQQAFDAALNQLRNGQFPAARDAFQGFIAQYPNSGYIPSARFWLGNAFYGTRQYKEAVDTFNQMLRDSPQNERAPDAALGVANSQLALKELVPARRTLENLITVYPNTNAAKEAKERLSHMH